MEQAVRTQGKQSDAVGVSYEMDRLTILRMHHTMRSAAIGALLVLPVLWRNNIQLMLVAWAVLVVSLSAWRWWYCNQLLKRTPEALRRGMVMVLWFSMLISASWTFIMWQPADATQLTALILIVTLISAGAVTAFAASPRFFYVYAWPVLLTLGVRLSLSDQPYAASVSACIVIFLIGTTALLRENYAALREQVSLRLETSRMAGELSALNREYSTELGMRRRTQRQLIARDEALQELYRVVSSHGLDYDQRLQQLLQLGCLRLGMQSGFVVIQAGEELRIEAQSQAADAKLIDREVLRSVHLAAQSAQEMLVASNVARDRRLADALAGGQPAIGSVVAVPFPAGNHSASVCFVDWEKHSEVAKFELDLVEVLTNWISLEVGRHIVLDDMRQSEEELRNLADVIPYYIAYCDRDLKYQFVNQALANLIGEPAEVLVGQSMRQRLENPEFAKISDYVTAALCGERQDFEFRLEGDDQIIDFAVTYLPDIRQGEVIGFYQILNDITDSKRETERLRHNTRHDQLTGLPNRTELYFHLEQLIDRRGVAGPHTLCYLDMDNFKPINDTIGHHAGDAALVWFGEQMRAVTRSSDICARIGGDEFAILLPGCGAQLARRITDELHQRLYDQPFVFDDKHFPLRVSAGVIEFRSGQGTPETLLKRADAVCYSAKHAGGGRTA